MQRRRSAGGTGSCAACEIGRYKVSRVYRSISDLAVLQKVTGAACAAGHREGAAAHSNARAGRAVKGVYVKVAGSGSRVERGLSGMYVGMGS